MSNLECDFGVCEPGPTALEPGGVAGSASSIYFSAWVFQIYAFARAAANGPRHYCSVLDTNCKEPGPIQNYASFLACEGYESIEDLSNHGAAHYGALAAGAVGMQQMYTYGFGTAKAILRAGLKKGVPVIGEIAAGYDAVMFDIEAFKANEKCTQAIYGNRF